MNDLLKRLTSKNISIGVVDNQLDIKAPKGAMTSELLSEIKENKDALLSFILVFSSDEVVVNSIPKAARKSSYSLSSSQFRLWLIEQAGSNNGTYNMPSVYSLKGSIDIQNLEKAFSKLIERHEILRTNFLLDKESGTPKQVIAGMDYCGFKLDYTDISKVEQKSLILQSLVEKEVSYNFDLETDALLRVSLIKDSIDDYKLIFVMHHIISDGWSSSILIRDLFSLYKSISLEEDLDIEPLPIQYKDFAEWQQSNLDSSAIETDKEYWLDQFKGVIPKLEIPTYKLRPSLKTNNGQTIEKQFNKETIDRFRNLCKSNGATTFMGLLSAVKILIYKYTSQTDIIIGSPFAGREHADLQNQIGFYVNTVGLRNSFKKEDTFILLLSQIKKTTLAAYEHQNYPFDELIKNLKLEGDRSRNPLFDVMLTVNSDNEMLGDFSSDEELDIAEITLEDTTCKFDLEFVFIEENEGTKLSLTYNSDIYTREFITQAANHLEVILKSIDDNPDVAIENIIYITSNEKETLIDGFNNTRIDFGNDNKTYIDIFEEQVKKSPKNIAIEFESKQINYEELDKLSNQFAHYLIGNYNVNLEDIVGVKLERSDWLIVSFLAILKTGGAYLPIDLDYPEERISFIESDSNCKVIIDHSIISDFINNNNQLETSPKAKSENSNLAYVIYTSGSTGTPKGTLIEHKNLVNLCFWHINQYSVTESSKGTLYSGIAFDASIWEMCPYLLAGASLFPVNNQAVRLDLKQLESFLAKHKITHSYLPTTICHELVNADFESERLNVLTGGDTLKITKQPKFKLFNNYGPTENTVVATSFDLEDGFDSTVPIGKPISNSFTYILDSFLELLPVGIPGQLFVAGAGVARGYLNLQDLTAERFVENPFIVGDKMYDTGDLAKWLPDGNIEFLGRKDSQVKIRGYRIELEEIENTIIRFSEDISQVVLDVRETDKGKELVTYYVSKTEIEKSLLRDFLLNRLPSYMVPTYYMAIESIQLTPNGKIDKKRLPEITSDSLVQKEYVAPRNEVEKQLVVIWQEVLGVNTIGIYDNFFELGGYSLQVTRMLHEINEFFDIQLQMKEVFAATNIHDLAQLVDNEQIFKAGISTDTKSNSDKTKNIDVWEI